MIENAALPDAWRELFDGTRPEQRLDVSAMLCTVGEDGWPHASFLGVGEILVHDTTRLGFLLWPMSTTARNVLRAGRATLFAAVAGSVWEARLSAHAREGDEAEGPRLFDGEVIAVRQHAAPYAEVTGMIGFRLLDPPGVLARWRLQIARLRGAG